MMQFNFNPRTPYGMRRGDTLSGIASKYDFNPRTPYGMRQPDSKYDVAGLKFQSTHPLRDATELQETLIRCMTEFQSTHPLRDAT